MGGRYANGTHRRRQGRKHNWQADAADAADAADICHEGRAMQFQYVSIAFEQFEHAKHSRVLRLCSGGGMLSAEAEWLKAEGTQGALKGH